MLRVMSSKFNGGGGGTATAPFSMGKEALWRGLAVERERVVGTTTTDVAMEFRRRMFGGSVVSEEESMVGLFVSFELSRGNDE